MILEELKQFNPKNGERMILIENGKPTVVLVSFEDYQKMLHFCDQPSQPIHQESEKKEPPALLEPTEPVEEKTDLTLADLPF